MKKKYKILITLLCVITFSIIAYFSLRAVGVTDIESLRSIVDKCGVWGWIVFLILQILITNLLCFIPGTNALFIGAGVALFGSVKAFFICSIGVYISSSIMFVLGRVLGEKVATKIVGEEDLIKAQNLIDVKSKIFLPLMFLFPMFPDDALCFASGMTKMKYWYFALIVFIFRSIGIATICFLGSDFFLNMFLQMNYIEMFMLINLFIIDIYAIIKMSLKLEKKIKEKKDDKR